MGAGECRGYTAAWLRAQLADWMCPDARFIAGRLSSNHPLVFFLIFFHSVCCCWTFSPPPFHFLLIASWSCPWDAETGYVSIAHVWCSVVTKKKSAIIRLNWADSSSSTYTVKRCMGASRRRRFGIHSFTFVPTVSLMKETKWRFLWYISLPAAGQQTVFPPTVFSSSFSSSFYPVILAGCCYVTRNPVLPLFPFSFATTGREEISSQMVICPAAGYRSAVKTVVGHCNDRRE